MDKKDEQDRTFNEAQQTMFQNAERNQNPEATRPAQPGVQYDPVIPGVPVSEGEESKEQEGTNKE